VQQKPFRSLVKQRGRLKSSALRADRIPGDRKRCKPCPKQDQKWRIKVFSALAKAGRPRDLATDLPEE